MLRSCPICCTATPHIEAKGYGDCWYYVCLRCGKGHSSHVR